MSKQNLHTESLREEEKREQIVIMQLLQNRIGPTIRIGQESWCLPYAGFFSDDSQETCKHAKQSITTLLSMP